MKRKRIDVVFLLGTNENYPKEAIQQENIEHQDILLVPVEDSYRNLVYKLLAGFRWISTNAPHSHVVKIDSDAIVELDELIPLVLDRDEDHSWIVGAVQENVPPSRDPSQKWFVSPESFEGELFPPYCNGPLYVISCIALKNLINSAKETKVIEVEDIFFTGILAERSGIKRFNDPRIGVARPSFDQCENAIAILAGYALQKMTRGPRQDYADFMVHKKFICANKFRELGFEN